MPLALTSSKDLSFVLFCFSSVSLNGTESWGYSDLSSDGYFSSVTEYLSFVFMVLHRGTDWSIEDYHIRMCLAFQEHTCEHVSHAALSCG